MGLTEKQKEDRRRASRKWRAKNPERVREGLAKWRAKNPTYQQEYWERNRLWLRARRYGLNPEQFFDLLDAQQGKCAICSRDLILGGKGGMQVDHDPKTRAVRGLLCRQCNVGLGLFSESPEILRSAIKYLSIKT